MRPRNALTVLPWPGQHFANLGREPGRDSLIAIDDEHPRIRGLRNGPILKSPLVRYSRSITRQPSDRAISSEPSVDPLSATMISVATSAHRRDARGQMGPLILARDDDGERLGHRSNSIVRRNASWTVRRAASSLRRVVQLGPDRSSPERGNWNAICSFATSEWLPCDER